MSNKTIKIKQTKFFWNKTKNLIANIKINILNFNKKI